MTTAKNIYDYINSIAPFDTQEEWDNAGFLIGEFRKEVKKAVLCLDVTKAVAQLAAEQGADLIISHHPIIFNPISEIKKGSAVYTCIEKNIAVISAHTNFDVAEGGINFNLARLLGLKNIRRIENSFLVLGELENEMSAKELAKAVNEILHVSGLRYTCGEKHVKIVAVGGGACEEYLDEAMSAADCFITGDAKYHFLLDCSEMGYPVFSAGHYETEYKPFLMLADTLRKMFPEVEFIESNQVNPVSAV